MGAGCCKEFFEDEGLLWEKISQLLLLREVNYIDHNRKFHARGMMGSIKTANLQGSVPDLYK